MSFSQNKRSAIVNYMLEKITESDPEFIRRTMEAFSISQNTVYRYLSELLDSGAVTRKKNGVYSIVNQTKQFTLRRDANELVDEQRIYERLIYDDYVGNLPENVRKIWDFSFTEMMNNAIDHSRAGEVTIVVSANRAYTSIIIYDNGIGIFKNIRNWFALDSIELTFSSALGEQWGNKELRKSIKSTFKTRRINGKIEVSYLRASGCILSTTTCAHIFIVITFFWIFFSSKKEHMFTEVSNSRNIIRVIQRTTINPHASSTIISILVTNDHNL